MYAIPDDFTHAGYRALLEALLNQGYEVRSYGDADPAARHLILRHDIDMSLRAAEPLAEIEQDLGVAAVYFVLVRTEMYNPFSVASRASLRRILDAGHSIGLHLDASAYGNDVSALDAAVDAECRALELATGQPVSIVSFHRPVEALQGLERSLAGRDHAYQPRFFTQMGYCSDSRCEWHCGHPLEHEAVAKGHALQLLTHPIWWTAKAGTGPVPKLEKLLDEQRGILETQLAENCEPYRLAHSGKDQRQD